MENKIHVFDDNGMEYDIELIRVILLDKYPDKKYVVYSLGEQIEEDSERIYVSILKETETENYLDSITDENELQAVMKEIQNRIEAGIEEENE